MFTQGRQMFAGGKCSVISAYIVSQPMLVAPRSWEDRLVILIFDVVFHTCN